MEQQVDLGLLIEIVGILIFDFFSSSSYFEFISELNLKSVEFKISLRRFCIPDPVLADTSQKETECSIAHSRAWSWMCFLPSKSVLFPTRITGASHRLFSWRTFHH